MVSKEHVSLVISDGGHKKKKKKKPKESTFSENWQKFVQITLHKEERNDFLKRVCITFLF